MKTLTKLAKSNNSILPILKTIQVLNGTATATDMDIEIRTASGLPEGVYHSEGFGELNIKADHEVADFPVFQPIEKPCGGMTLDKKGIADLTFVSGAMGTEETRYYLVGVYFDGPGQCIIATTGHVLKKAAMTVPAGVKHICPAKAVKLVLDLVKETKATEVDVSFWEGKIVFTVGAFTLVTKTIDGTFPDHERVIPATGVTTVNYSGAALKNNLKEIKSLAKIAGEPKLMKVVLNGALSAYGREYATPFTMPFPIGFNGNLLADVMDGEMSIGSDAREPVVVRNGNLTDVIMPTRI